MPCNYYAFDNTDTTNVAVSFFLTLIIHTTFSHKKTKALPTLLAIFGFLTRVLLI